MNECIFILHTIFVGFVTLAAARAGKEALIAAMCLFCLLANLFVTKQAVLFGLNATCSDAFAIGAVLVANLLQELYGQRYAIKAVWISFGSSCAYAVFSYLHLLYLPACCDTAHPHFEAILSSTPRIVAASLIVYMVVQYMDSGMFAWLKKRFTTQHFIARALYSTIISQLIDTVLFSFLGLYGMVDNILQIIIISYCIKIIALFMAAPFAALAKKVVLTDSSHQTLESL